MNGARAGSGASVQLRRRTAHPLVALAVALTVAACAGPTELSAPPSVAATSPSPSAEVSPSPPPPSDPPTETPSESPSEPPPSEPAVSSLPSPSGAGSAGACTGDDKNRNFFRLAAEDLAWDVYCAVLPAGWFVGNGNYTVARGGKLTITYNGPGDARLELTEGSFCAAAAGCLPQGSDVGPAAFGDREGILVAITDGSWAVVVDRGDPIGWQIVGIAIGETAFRGFAAALNRVD